MTDAVRPAGRRRRRAVGPPGAPVSTPVEPAQRDGLAERDEPTSAEDDEERLRRDVPPHHGS